MGLNERGPHGNLLRKSNDKDATNSFSSFARYSAEPTYFILRVIYTNLTPFLFRTVSKSTCKEV